MTDLKLGLLQLNPTIGDFAGNAEKLLKAYAQAVERGAQLVLAPELFLTGYPPQDLLLRDDFIERSLKTVSDVAAQIGAVPLLVGYVDRNPQLPGRPLNNNVAYLHAGQIKHRVTKSLLPTYDVFDEDRYFEPQTHPAPLRTEEFPFPLGVTICEDIWNDADFWAERRYPLDPVAELRRAGASIILNLSASPWHVGKERMRRAMLQRVARDEGVPVVQVNCVGGNDELVFDGHSVVFNGRGECIFAGVGFTEEVSVVSLNAAPVSEPVIPDTSKLHAALCLGLRDYVRKTGFQKVVLGLSGGIDSALVAALAAHALGPENVLGVSLPSRYSSRGSMDDALVLARNLGIRYEVVSIESPFQSVLTQLNEVFQGTKPDTTEENIQSRLRAVALMALSNKFGHLVLTTGNKSEMAVGYCTLYGDMCGALNPIADLFKTQVYELARWINRDREIIPASTINKAPSAELRPNQTDQDSLPPYEVLDSILDAYVVRNLSKKEIVALGHPETVVTDVLNKITFSEYKRRQAAPGLKVSPRAFGLGRRIPLAQRFRA